MTTLETISTAELASVGGGVSGQAKEVCNRAQFDWMAAHMVPNTGLHPGVQQHVVANDAKLCGFPMPK